MAVRMHETDQDTRAKLHATLAKYGYVLVEVPVEPAGPCGYPGGCGRPADWAVFAEFRDGSNCEPLPACKAHVPEAAAEIFTAYGGVDDSATQIPLFLGEL